MIAAAYPDRFPPNRSPAPKDCDVLDVDVLLLDLDGTLLDFEASQAEALRSTVADLGLEWSEDLGTTYADINGALWGAYERREIAAADLRRTRWARYLEALSVDADPDAVGEGYLTAFAAGAHVLPGAVEAVQALADRHRLAVITNGFGDVQHERLERSGLDRHMEAVVVSDVVGASKPDRRIFDAAFDAMGGPARDRTAIVGDSLSADVAGGHAYGITTVWVNAGGAPAVDGPAPHHEIRSVTELV